MVDSGDDPGSFYRVAGRLKKATSCMSTPSPETAEPPGGPAPCRSGCLGRAWARGSQEVDGNQAGGSGFETQPNWILGGTVSDFGMAHGGKLIQPQISKYGLGGKYIEKVVFRDKVYS